MKKVYVVTSASYRPAVAFEDPERAELVRKMCDGSVDEIDVLDAGPSLREVLEVMDWSPGDDPDGEVPDGDGEDGDDGL